MSEDIVVPRSRIRDFFEGLEAMGLPTVTYGHLGDGNLHVNLLAAGETEPAELERQLMALFGLCVRLGGALSGEHGIGLAKRDGLPALRRPLPAGGPARAQAGPGSLGTLQSRERSSEAYEHRSSMSLLLGHRGLSARHLENSMEAFRAALAGRHGRLRAGCAAHPWTASAASCTTTTWPARPAGPACCAS